MRTKVSYNILIIILSAIALLPFRILYTISDMLYVFVYHILRYRRSIVYRNLMAAFPQYDKEKLRKIERGFYHHLCDQIIETIKLLSISDAEIDRRVTVVNSYIIEKYAQDNKPIILFMGHYCNWEWVTAIPRHYTHPPISCQIYKPLRNETFNMLMLKIRSRFGSISIAQKKAARTLIRLKNDNKTFITGFISDSRPNSKDTQWETLFMNQPTTFSPGGEVIGRKIGAVFLYLDIEKTSRGHYRLAVNRIIPQDIGTPYPYTKEYFKLLEKTINRQPYYWLWSHNRWLFNSKIDNISKTTNKIQQTKYNNNEYYMCYSSSC